VLLNITSVIILSPHAFVNTFFELFYDLFRKSFSKSSSRFIQTEKTAQPCVFHAFTLTTIFCTLLAIFSAEQLGLCNSHGKKIAKSPEFNTVQFFSCGSA